MPEFFEGYFDSFKQAFDSEAEPIRFIQSKMLLDHFYNNPILGVGTGYPFYDTVRGKIMYEQELTYLFILATRGIIGFLLYFGGVVGPLICGYKLSKKSKDVVLAAFTFGYLFIVIADATNPVLCSLDLMMPLFIMYAKINQKIQFRNNETL